MPMFRTGRIVSLVVLAALLLPALPAWGAVFGGTVESASSATGQVVIKFRTSDRTRTFRVPPRAEVTLNGQEAKLDDLAAGLLVTVVTDNSGAVTRVTAREPAEPVPARPSTDRPTDDEPASLPLRAGRGRREAARSDSASESAWPQFRGPNRDNLSGETGLDFNWGRGGPRMAWSARGLGEAYSTVAVADGLVLTMGNQANREMVRALDLKTGRPAWSAPTGGPAYQDGTGNGPRGTPTVDGDVLYALGPSGDLACIELAGGNVRWTKNILREFGGRNITWGISESVLIDGDRLICTPGGPGATMVALDKNTGETIWQAEVPGNPSAAYASAIAVEVGGVRQYVNFTSRSVIGVRASDGRFLWEDNSAANGTANISSPVFDDGHVFSASGYGTGGALVRLSPAGDGTSAQRVYHTSDMKNHHGGMVVVDGHLYGSNDPGILTCIELKTGDVKWQNRSVGKGSVVYADGHIILRSEQGPVAAVEATPEGYREKGRFDQPQRSGRPAWSHPVVADGKLFLRDMDVLLCYDLTGGGRR